MSFNLSHQLIDVINLDSYNSQTLFFFLHLFFFGSFSDFGPYSFDMHEFCCGCKSKQYSKQQQQQQQQKSDGVGEMAYAANTQRNVQRKR